MAARTNERITAGSPEALAHHHEYPGADDGADAEGGEAYRPDSPFQLVAGLVGLFDQ